MNSRPVRVLLLVDRELVDLGLRGMLAAHGDRIEVLDGTDAHPADVEVLDASANGGDAVDSLTERSASGAGPRQVVLVDVDASARVVRRAIETGAGLLLTSEPAAAMADALVRAAAGGAVVSPSLETTVAAVGARRWLGDERGLSRRESQVLVLIAAGRTPEEIASELTIAHETVRSHLKRIYHKLGVRDRATAVAKAWREGIVDRHIVAAGSDR